MAITLRAEVRSDHGASTHGEVVGDYRACPAARSTATVVQAPTARLTATAERARRRPGASPHGEIGGAPAVMQVAIWWIKNYINL